MANPKRNKWDKGRWPVAYHHAIAIQAILFDHIQSQDVAPNVKAALAKAYCSIEEMKRIMTMRPAPKAIAVEVKRNTDVEVASFIDESQQPADNKAIGEG